VRIWYISIRADHTLTPRCDGSCTARCVRAYKNLHATYDYVVNRRNPLLQVQSV